MRSRATTGRWRTYTFLYLLLLLSLQSRAVLADEPRFPPLTGRVVDDAGILSDSTRAALTDMLAQHERETSNQMVVVTLKDLQGYTIEDFGYQLGRKWGIGQKEKNNGVLLIVAPKEHRVRIEVGYGLEGTLTDAVSRTIIEEEILPAFRRGDYNGGVLAGTASILTRLGGSAVTSTPSGTERGASYDSPTWFVALWLLALCFVWVKGVFFDGGAWGGGGFVSGDDLYGGGGSGGGGFFGGGGSFGGGGASGGGGGSGGW
jgi:uncharacterized protein